jgi:hypothetical protein
MDSLRAFESGVNETDSKAFQDLCLKMVRFIASRDARVHRDIVDLLKQYHVQNFDVGLDGVLFDIKNEDGTFYVVRFYQRFLQKTTWIGHDYNFKTNEWKYRKPRVGPQKRRAIQSILKLLLSVNDETKPNTSTLITSVKVALPNSTPSKCTIRRALLQLTILNCLDSIPANGTNKWTLTEKGRTLANLDSDFSLSKLSLNMKTLSTDSALEEALKKVKEKIPNQPPQSSHWREEASQAKRQGKNQTYR